MQPRDHPASFEDRQSPDGTLNPNGGDRRLIGGYALCAGGHRRATAEIVRAGPASRADGSLIREAFGTCVTLASSRKTCECLGPYPETFDHGGVPVHTLERQNRLLNRHTARDNGLDLVDRRGVARVPAAASLHAVTP